MESTAPLEKETGCIIEHNRGQQQYIYTNLQHAEDNEIAHSAGRLFNSRVGNAIRAPCAILCFLLVSIYGIIQLRGESTPSGDTTTTTTTGLFKSWDDFRSALNSDKPAEYSERILLPSEERPLRGLLSVQMAAVETVIDTGIECFHGRTYDGHTQGRLFRLKANDTLVINFTNALCDDKRRALSRDKHVITSDEAMHLTQMDIYTSTDNITNIHTHGLHVSPAGNSDNIYIAVPPGRTFRYEYHISSNHPPGTYYIHPHFAGNSFQQVLSGMVSSLIVEDTMEEDVPEELTNIDQDIVFIMTDVNFDKLQRFSDSLHSTPIVGGKLGGNIGEVDETLQGRFWTVNGRFQPIIDLSVRETVRLRFIHAGSNHFLRLSIPLCQMVLVARDGIYLSAPRTVDYILIPGGSRADVLVSCPYESDFTVRTSSTSETKQYLGEDAQTQTLAFLRVKQPPSRVVVNTSSSMPTWLPDVSTFGLESLMDITNTNPKWVCNFSEFANGTFGINGLMFTEDVIQRMIELGTVEEWRIINSLPSQHSFHIHVNHFQIINSSLSGSSEFQDDWKIGDWRDTITVPVNGGWVDIRFRADDFVGKSVAHCHIFGHIDKGMALNVSV